MVELIHASSGLTELGVITDFTRFDASAALSSSGQESDWMLEMPSEVYLSSPVSCGDYVYIEGTEFGGRCERVRHSTSDGAVRMYGPCWRGMLGRRIITPPAGQTHLIISALSGKAALETLLGDWCPGLITVGNGDGGITVSARIRYKTFAECAESALIASNARLSVSFGNKTLTLEAKNINDLSGSAELSGEYDSDLISDLRSPGYNHIIALGRGEMLERQVAELWLLPGGTVTDDSSLFPADAEVFSLLYDYTFAEDIDELKAQARRKILENASAGSMEFELYDGDAGLELCDRVSVRDGVTGVARSMSVEQKSILLTADGCVMKHILV